MVLGYNFLDKMTLACKVETNTEAFKFEPVYRDPISSSVDGICQSLDSSGWSTRQGGGGYPWNHFVYRNSSPFKICRISQGFLFLEFVSSSQIIVNSKK